MKKLLALLLALTMVFALSVTAFADGEAVDPDSIEDNMTSADNTYEVMLSPTWAS